MRCTKLLMRSTTLHNLSLRWLYFHTSLLSPFWARWIRSYVLFTQLLFAVLQMMFIAEVDKWTLILGHRVHRGIQKFLSLQPLSGMHHVHVLIRRGVWGHLLLLSLDVQLSGVPRRDRGHLFLIRLEVQVGSISSRMILTRWYVSNVSIIFDAPSLFLHHLLCVLLNFVAFLCIFWN
jgi:hypothetical protein